MLYLKLTHTHTQLYFWLLFTLSVCCCHCIVLLQTKKIATPVKLIETSHLNTLALFTVREEVVELMALGTGSFTLMLDHVVVKIGQSDRNGQNTSWLHMAHEDRVVRFVRFMCCDLTVCRARAWMAVWVTAVGISKNKVTFLICRLHHTFVYRAQQLLQRAVLWRVSPHKIGILQICSSHQCFFSSFRGRFPINATILEFAKWNVVKGQHTNDNKPTHNMSSGLRLELSIHPNTVFLTQNIHHSKKARVK